MITTTQFVQDSEDSESVKYATACPIKPREMHNTNSISKQFEKNNVRQHT